MSDQSKPDLSEIIRPELPAAPARPISADEFWEQRNREARDAPSFIEAVGTSILVYDALAAATRWYHSGSNDPEWREKHTQDLPGLLADIPFAFQDDILDADSYEHAEQVKDELQAKFRASERLGREGAFGVAAALGIGVLELIPATILTGGTSLPAYLSAGGAATSAYTAARVASASIRSVEAARAAAAISRYQLFATGAGVGALSGLSYVALDSMVDDTVESSDFYMAAAFGSGLGSLANGLLGRSIIKNSYITQAHKYEQRLTLAGKELAVRFGADDAVEQISRRFGVSSEDATAMIISSKGLTSRTGGSAGVWDDVAVAGPRARLRSGQEVVESFEFAGGKASVEHLSDGRTVIRALSDAKSPQGFFDGAMDVIRRRLINEDSDLLSNSEVLALDDLMGGRVSRASRTVRTTTGVEQGTAPTGLRQWEVRLGNQFKEVAGTSVPWSPATSAARTKLQAARKAMESAYQAFVKTRKEAGFFLTEADTFENLVTIDGLPVVKAARAELRKAAAALKQTEDTFRGFHSRDLVEQAGRVVKDLSAAHKRAKDAVTAAGKEIRDAKRLKKEITKEMNAKMKAATDAEGEASSKLRQAEDLAGDMDAEFMIRRRKDPLTNEEVQRLSTALVGWFKRGGAADINAANPALSGALEKLQRVLSQVYVDATDPLLGAVAPNAEIDSFFRDVFRKQAASQALASREDGASMFDRLTAIANGVSHSSPLTRQPPVPGSRPADWDDVPRVEMRVFGLAFGWLGKWLNQSAAAQNSGSGVVRWLGNRLFWSRVAPVDASGNPVAQRATIFERMGTLRRTLTVKYTREFKNALNEYVYGTPNPDEVGVVSKTVVGWKHETYKRFNREVHDEIVSPGSSTNTAVKKAATAFREHYSRMRALAEEVGLPGFVGLDADGAYFPRLWRWQLIDDFTKDHGGFNDLAKMIRESLTIPVVKSVDDPLFIAGEAITEAGRDALAVKTANRLRELARGERKNANIDMDEVLLQILHEEAPAPVKGKGPFMTPRGRRRIPMDITRQVHLSNGQRISLSELVSTDVMTSTASYDRSVFGAMGEKILVDEFKDQLVSRGRLTAEEAATRIKTYGDVRSFALSSEMKYGVTGEEAEQALQHIDELMAGLHSEPVTSQLGSAFSPWFSRFRKLAYIASGQAFGLSALTESGRILGRTSFNSISKQLPIINELRQAAQAGNISKERHSLLSLMDQALGTGSDRLRRTELAIVDSRLEEYGLSVRKGWTAKLDNWIKSKIDPKLDQATILMSDVTGLAPITSATQHLMTASLIQEVFDNARKGVSTYSDELLAQWGVTRAEFNAFSKKLSETGKVNSAGRVIDIDRVGWSPEVYDRFLTFLERGTISSIQDPPVRGDFSKIFWSEWGRLLTQFRTFNIKGISNFLMTSSQRMDSRVAAEYMAVGSLALMTQMARKAIFAPTYKTKKEQDKYWEDSYSLAALASYFGSGPAENFLIMSGVDSVAQAFTGKTVLSPYVRYSGLGGSPFDISATPAWSVVESGFKAIRGPINAALRQDRDFSKKDLNNITMIIPFRKIAGVFNAVNAAENGIGSYLNLPDKSATTDED